MTFKESFNSRVRSIENDIITIEWYNSNRDLIGLKVERECLELFEKRTWIHRMHELILNIKVQSICVLFTFSLIISGLHSSYTALLGKGFL
jgi:hypothetical protein